MASKLELAEKKASEATAKLERLRAHDTLVSTIETALKSARRKDYVPVSALLANARTLAEAIDKPSREQRVAAEQELLSAGKA